MAENVTTVVPKKRKWKGRLLIAFLMLAGAAAGLAWFAPALIAMTALKQRVPKFLFPSYPGTIELGATSLGWLSPVVIHDL